MEERTCEGCHEKDTTAELRQNDLLMCDLCWGRPMSEDSIIYRNTLIMKDVDIGVLEKSPIVVKCVKLLTDDEAVPAILDVATPSAVEVKEQIKDNNEDNKQNASNDGENEPKPLDTEDEDTYRLTEEESGVKAKSEKLEGRNTNPNIPVKHSPSKPKTSSSRRRKSSCKETKHSSKAKFKKHEKEASESKEVPNGKNKVTVTDSSAKVGPKSTPSSERKKRIIIAGDSIVKDIKGWLMSRQKSVKVHSFSGADTADMEHFLQPLINTKPD